MNELITQKAVGSYDVADTIAAEDDAFHRRLTRVFLINGAWMWATALVAALALAGLAALAVGPGASLVIAGVAAVLFGVGGAVVTWLIAQETVDHHFRRIRSRAKISAERVRADDADRMSDGVRTVIFEWYHGRETLRQKDVLSGAFIAASLLAAAILALIGGALAPMLGRALGFSEGVATATVILPALIAAGHGASSAAMGWRILRERCWVVDADDPATAIVDRLRTLFSEVKELRARGATAAG